MEDKLKSIAESDRLRCEADALCEQADAKSHEAYELRKSACEKYELSSAGDPDNYETLHNWAMALIDLAETGTGEWKKELMTVAEEKLVRADSLNSEFSSWVLAGMVAIQGREQDTQRWLERAVEVGFLDKDWRDILQRAPAFEAYRSKDWFQRILSEL